MDFHSLYTKVSPSHLTSLGHMPLACMGEIVRWTHVYTHLFVFVFLYLVFTGVNNKCYYSVHLLWRLSYYTRGVAPGLWGSHTSGGSEIESILHNWQSMVLPFVMDLVQRWKELQEKAEEWATACKAESSKEDRCVEKGSKGCLTQAVPGNEPQQGRRMVMESNWREWVPYALCPISCSHSSFRFMLRSSLLMMKRVSEWLWSAQLLVRYCYRFRIPLHIANKV